MHQPIEVMDILWLTAGLSCDGDTIAMTAATSAQHRGTGARRHPAGFPRSGSTIPCSPTKTATSSCKFSATPPRESWKPFILVVEGSIPDETQQGRRLLGDVRNRSAIRPADLHHGLDRLGWRPKPGQWWRPELARPTAEFTPWREIRPVAMGFRIISAGIGNRQPASRWFAFRVARFSRTT